MDEAKNRIKRINPDETIDWTGKEQDLADHEEFLEYFDNEDQLGIASCEEYRQFLSIDSKLISDYVEKRLSGFQKVHFETLLEENGVLRTVVKNIIKQNSHSEFYDQLDVSETNNSSIQINEHHELLSYENE